MIGMKCLGVWKAPGTKTIVGLEDMLGEERECERFGWESLETIKDENGIGRAYSLHVESSVLVYIQAEKLSGLEPTFRGPFVRHYASISLH